MSDWMSLYYRMKNCAAGYSNYCEESGSTRKLEREFEQIDSDARSLKSSPPVAVQEEGDAKDAKRYRLLRDNKGAVDMFCIAVGLSYCNTDEQARRDAMDTAIDAAMKGDQP